VVEISSALRHNSTLSMLCLDSSGLDDKGATALAYVLRHNSTLTDLTLRNNEIGAHGAKAIGHALPHNSKLELLDLSNNNAGSEGAAALVDGLRENATLRWLDLGNNDIDDDEEFLFHEIELLLSINDSDPPPLAFMVKKSVYPTINKIPDSVMPSVLARVGQLPARFSLTTTYRIVKEMNWLKET